MHTKLYHHKVIGAFILVSYSLTYLDGKIKLYDFPKVSFTSYLIQLDLFCFLFFFLLFLQNVCSLTLLTDYAIIMFVCYKQERVCLLYYYYFNNANRLRVSIVNVLRFGFI